MADQKMYSVSKSITNLVLLGRTGNGKSSTGNSLLGQRLFVSKLGAGGITLECEMYTVIHDGLMINVIDTPGFFDLSVSTDYICKEINSCLHMAEEGIHAVLFVISARNRISQEEESTVNTLERIFGSKIFDYMIIVFTGGDVLEEDDMTLDDYLHDGCPQFLKRLLRVCHGRKVLFDNRTKDNNKKAKQLKQLYTHVADVRKQNSAYTYQMQLQIKLRETTERLEKQLGEEQAARLEAEKRANEVQKRSSDEIKKLRENLERAEKETKELQMGQVEDALKQIAIAHEREMRQQNQQRQLVEDVVKQNAAAHEKEIRQLKEELQHHQAQQLLLAQQPSSTRPSSTNSTPRTYHPH